MPYCPECGDEVTEDDEFCSNCGASLRGSKTPQKRTAGRSSKTALGLSENIEAVIAYLLIWVSGIVIFVLEEENKFVRFHAMQSIIVFLPLTIISWIFGAISGPLFWSIGTPFMGGPLLLISQLIGVVIFVLWLLLMFKAYSGEMYELPIAGEIAKNQSLKK